MVAGALQKQTPGAGPGVGAAWPSLDLRRLRKRWLRFFSCLSRAEACFDLSLRRLPLRGDSQDFKRIAIWMKELCQS